MWFNLRRDTLVEFYLKWDQIMLVYDNAIKNTFMYESRIFHVNEKVTLLHREWTKEIGKTKSISRLETSMNRVVIVIDVLAADSVHHSLKNNKVLRLSGRKTQIR